MGLPEILHEPRHRSRRDRGFEPGLGRVRVRLRSRSCGVQRALKQKVLRLVPREPVHRGPEPCPAVHWLLALYRMPDRTVPKVLVGLIVVMINCAELLLGSLCQIAMPLVVMLA